jgi:hypothetical protein
MSMGRLLVAIFIGALLVSLTLPSLAEPSEQPISRDSSAAAQQTEEDPEKHQCRLWGMIADSLPEDVVLDHLVDCLFP